MAARSDPLGTEYEVGVFNKRDGIAVQGYVRREFAKKYMVDAIVRIIVKFYMSNGGSLYVCGKGYDGEEPTICPPFSQNNCIDIASGLIHTVALGIDGSVWRCAHGRRKALANGQASNVNVMTKISMSDRAIAVSAGIEHS